MLFTDVTNYLDILADQLKQEAKKTTVYEVELAPEIRNISKYRIRRYGQRLLIGA